MDHRDLLKRYMASVILTEGYDYLSRFCGSEAEHSELATIAAEARELIDERIAEHRKASEQAG